MENFIFDKVLLPDDPKVDVIVTKEQLDAKDLEVCDGWYAMDDVELAKLNK